MFYVSYISVFLKVLSSRAFWKYHTSKEFLEVWQLLLKSYYVTLYKFLWIKPLWGSLSTYFQQEVVRHSLSFFFLFSFWGAYIVLATKSLVSIHHYTAEPFSPFCPPAPFTLTTNLICLYELVFALLLISCFLIFHIQVKFIWYLSFPMKAPT